MRTSGILTIGGGVIALLGAIFGMVMLKAFFVDRGEGFVDVTGILCALGILAAGLGALAYGRRRAVIEREADERGFAETAETLARRAGGRIALEQVCKATGLPSGEVQAKMRQLTGRGLFDLDFDGNGQMVYKVSLSDEPQLKAKLG